MICKVLEFAAVLHCIRQWVTGNRAMTFLQYVMDEHGSQRRSCRCRCARVAGTGGIPVCLRSNSGEVSA